MILGAYNNGISNNSFTKLLLHFDETGVPPTFLDSSPSNHTINKSGSAIEDDSTNKKFGRSSATFPGTDGKLYLDDSNDWYFDGDFTIDMWLKNTLSANGTIAEQRTALQSDTSIAFKIRSSGLVNALISDGITWSCNIDSTTAVNDDNWHHIAYVVKNETIKIYVDGNEEASASNIIDIPDSSVTFKIGLNYSGGEPYDNNIDEYRITKGEALWTRNFTVPNRAS